MKNKLVVLFKLYCIAEVESALVLWRIRIKTIPEKLFKIPFFLFCYNSHIFLFKSIKPWLVRSSIKKNSEPKDTKTVFFERKQIKKVLKKHNFGQLGPLCSSEGPNHFERELKKFLDSYPVASTYHSLIWINADPYGSIFGSKLKFLKTFQNLARSDRWTTWG